MKSLIFVWTVLAFVSVAYADPARDSFRYSPVGSDLNGSSGGGSFGMSGAWLGDSSFDIGSGSLVDPTRTLAVSGNRMTSISFNDNRDLTRLFTNAFGTDNTTTYLSFIIRPQGVLGQGAFGAWFGVALRGTQNDVLVGLGPHSLYVMERPGGANQATTTKTAAVGESTFFTMRIDSMPGNDNIRLYVNPTPGGAEPATPSATITAMDLGLVVSLSLSGPGSFGVDEIQAGPTFSSVTKKMIPGDFDADGDVDGADFVSWQSNFPTQNSETVMDGDADRDGDVDGADFVVWQTNFPFAPSPGIAPVPEPSTIALVLLSVPALFALRRRLR